MRGNRAPGRGFEPWGTDPEPGVRDGDAAPQKVSGFTPRALLHARQREIYPKCAEMTMIARKWVTGVKIGSRAFRRQERAALTSRWSRGPVSDARDDAQPPAGRVRRNSGRRVRDTRSAA